MTAPPSEPRDPPDTSVTMPIPLPTAATELATTPTALIEMALLGQLILYVWQEGWTYVGVLFGAEIDVETFTPVELVPELEPPYQLRPGLIRLERYQLAQLRSGRMLLRDAGDAVSGFQVLLAEPIELGWDSVMIEPRVWEAFKSTVTATQLPRIATTSAVSTADVPDAAERTAQAVERLATMLETALDSPLPVEITGLQGVSRRALLRMLAGRGAILPAHVAAELLPMDDAAAMAWLRKNKLIRGLDGRKVVSMAKVTDKLYEDQGAGDGSSGNATKPRGPVRGELKRSSAFD